MIFNIKVKEQLVRKTIECEDLAKRYENLQRVAKELAEESQKVSKKLEEILKQKPNIDETMKLIADIQQAGGGIVEIRRVDPNNIFLRGMS